PTNVLVGSDRRVRVSDFGLARAAHPPHTLARPMAGALAQGALVTTITETGALHGTPAYMAPEQFMCEPTDARTDEFSFCVALFEALYGVRPFAADGPEALPEAVTSGRVRPAPPRPSVPPRLYDVLRRGLRPIPEDRFPSMEALLEALSAVLRERERSP